MSASYSSELIGRLIEAPLVGSMKVAAVTAKNIVRTTNTIVISDTVALARSVIPVATMASINKTTMAAAAMHEKAIALALVEENDRDLIATDVYGLSAAYCGLRRLLYCLYGAGTLVKQLSCFFFSIYHFYFFSKDSSPSFGCITI